MNDINHNKKAFDTSEVAEASMPFLIPETLQEETALSAKEFGALVNGYAPTGRVAPVKTERTAVIEELRKIEYRTHDSAVYDFSKRALDICASFAALLVFAIPMLFIALAVKLTSRGPALFRDTRVGKDGKKITVYKFRTMYRDAEKRIRSYLSAEEYEAWLSERKIENDPRITRVGRLLRKTSLDELPQLFNILGGSLSVIGPRPITNDELSRNYTPVQQKVLLSCKPGLSGLWASSGRSDITYSDGERQKMELEYVKKRGFFYDIKLIFKTIASVLRGKGAQ